MAIRPCPRACSNALFISDNFLGIAVIGFNHILNRVLDIASLVFNAIAHYVPGSVSSAHPPWLPARIAWLPVLGSAAVGVAGVCPNLGN